MIVIQPSASRTTNPRAPTPAVNCWATIIRSLCGLITLLFGQSQLEPISLAPGFSQVIIKMRPRGKRLNGFETMGWKKLCSHG
jgi:hypothetical protein